MRELAAKCVENVATSILDVSGESNVALKDVLAISRAFMDRATAIRAIEVGKS